VSRLHKETTQSDEPCIFPRPTGPYITLASTKTSLLDGIAYFVIISNLYFLPHRCHRDERIRVCFDDTSQSTTNQETQMLEEDRDGVLSAFAAFCEPGRCRRRRQRQ
jgi:hypothetical protein